MLDMPKRIISSKFCFLSENTEDNLKNENKHKNDEDLKNYNNLQKKNLTSNNYGLIQPEVILYWQY